MYPLHMSVDVIDNRRHRAFRLTEHSVDDEAIGFGSWVRQHFVNCI